MIGLKWFAAHDAGKERSEMHRNKTVDNRGFTLAETLLVVAIVVILMGVVFISLAHHQRTTKLLEMDGIAKEIYIAAQNHLSLADSQGLISQRSNAGTQEGSSDVYYFIVSPSYEPVTKSDSVLNLMLPLAAVDETVRLGGSYIVRYQKSSATVLDVFYSNREGVRFGTTSLEPNRVIRSLPIRLTTANPARTTAETTAARSSAGTAARRRASLLRRRSLPPILK